MLRKQENKPQIVNDSARTVIHSYQFRLPPLKKKKRALLSYLTSPVASEIRGEELVRFSNHGLAVCWAHVLNKLGYIVDIIEWDDKTFVPLHDYDLIVFHGGNNFKQIMAHVKNKPRIIHWLTGSYWKFNNEAEDKRIADFAKRHGVKVPRDRYIHTSEDEVNEAADGIIVLGDPSMRDTYPKSYKKVLTVNNASYPDDHFSKTKKDYERVKQNFLFFAGAGNVHKGLDLLIDAFKDLDAHLTIVAHTDDAVMKVFERELKLPNIHLLGEVGMRTAAFYEIMDNNAFVILPSCSEGQAGSVVECINQGLVPIVSKETRLDTTGYGVTLRNCSITEIKKTVSHYSGLPAAAVAKLSKKSHKAAAKYHTPSYFRKQLKVAIKESLR